MTKKKAIKRPQTAGIQVVFFLSPKFLEPEALTVLSLLYQSFILYL